MTTTEQIVKKFDEWLAGAKAHAQIAEPTAMTLATANADAGPSARIVLLKAHDARGFVFYTNLESRKGEQLAENAQAALCFYWMPLERQVRIEGKTERVSNEEADAYFASRPRESQLGAWASRQSQPLSERSLLEERLKEAAARFEGKPVTRPPHWSGTRVIPSMVEFWQMGSYRLHDREVYTRTPSGVWELTRLYP